jgi:Arc/MetJ family transcription regulator
MSKLLVDVDDELLAIAASKLGTTTKKDTINTALAQVVDLREDPPARERFRRITQHVGRQLAEISREDMWRRR